MRALKREPGKNILTDCSIQLVHTLLANDLVDELHLLVYPIMVGNCKRLIPDGVDLDWTLQSTTHSPTGVVRVSYVRDRAPK